MKALMTDREWDRVTRTFAFEDGMPVEILDQIDAGAKRAIERATIVTSETGGKKGQKQCRISEIDPWALEQLGRVAGHGGQKYDRLNYMLGYNWSLAYDALQRHLLLFWQGEDIDPDSGLPHLGHAAWHCLALMAFFRHDKGTDDRFKDGVADDQPE